MDKKEFYREQAEKFIVYFYKFLPVIFEKWTDSKDFPEEDRKAIWEWIRIKINKK